MRHNKLSHLAYIFNIPICFLKNSYIYIYIYFFKYFFICLSFLPFLSLSAVLASPHLKWPSHIYCVILTSHQSFSSKKKCALLILNTILYHCDVFRRRWNAFFQTFWKHTLTTPHCFYFVLPPLYPPQKMHSWQKKLITKIVWPRAYICCSFYAALSWIFISYQDKMVRLVLGTLTVSLDIPPQVLYTWQTTL